MDNKLIIIGFFCIAALLVVTTQAGPPLLDMAITDGLSGTQDSLAYRIHEIEKHHHNVEIWYGDGGTNDLATNLTEIQATAGTSEAYGSYLQISDGDDIESGDSSKYLDMHEILVTAVSAANKVYKLSFSSGTGAAGDSVEYAEAVGFFPATGKSAPIETMSKRIPCNHKIWVRVACETDAATIDFLVGVHTYDG